MKAIKIILIVLLIGVLLFGIAFLMGGGKDGIAKAEPRYARSITEENEVTSLKLVVSSDDVEFKPSEDGKLKIEYFDYEKPAYEYSYSNGVATMSTSELSINNWSRLFRIRVNEPEYKMIVYLPATVTNELNLSVASGSVNTDQALTLTKLIISVSSGEVAASNVTADTIKLTTSSGDIALSTAVTSALECTTSSGGITLNDVTAESSKLDTSSGDITVNGGALGATDAKISSGDMGGTDMSFSSLNVRISSGSANLELKGDAATYHVAAQVSSGSVTITDGNNAQLLDTRSDATYGNGSVAVTLHVSSGDVKIKFTE